MIEDHIINSFSEEDINFEEPKNETPVSNNIKRRLKWIEAKDFRHSFISGDEVREYIVSLKDFSKFSDNSKSNKLSGFKHYYRCNKVRSRDKLKSIHIILNINILIKKYKGLNATQNYAYIFLPRAPQFNCFGQLMIFAKRSRIHVMKWN